MSDAAELLLVFSIIYFLECLQMVPRGAVAVLARLSCRFTLTPALPIGLRRGAALILGMPFPPMGLLLVVDEWPLVLGEHEVLRSDGARWPWSDVREARAVETRVVAGNETLATLATEPGAAGLARALRDIAGATPAERARRIDDVLAARLDATRVQRRVEEFRRAVWPLRIAESLLFLALFAGGPVLLFTSLSGLWLEVAVVALVSWVATVVAYVRARAVCFTEDDGPPSGRTLILALWPIAALRASDLLGRYLLAGAAPLAAATLLPAPAFAAAARRALAELRHGEAPADAWFDERLASATSRLLREQKLQPDALFAPPAPDEPAALAFCPRCHAQYVVARPACASCAAIRLLPLTGGPDPSPAPSKKRARRRRR